MTSWRSRFVVVGLAVLALFLSLSPVVSAQTATATAAPAQHFTLSGSVVSFMGPSGAAPASIADGYMNATKSWLVGYQQVTIPSLATAKFGVVAFQHPLNALLGKKLNAKLVFDASKVNLTFYGGAGKLNESNLGVNRVAETGGICASYPVSGNVSIKLVCGQWIHGGIVNGPIVSGLPTSAASNSSAVSSGVQVHF